MAQALAARDAAREQEAETAHAVTMLEQRLKRLHDECAELQVWRTHGRAPTEVPLIRCCGAGPLRRAGAVDDRPAQQGSSCPARRWMHKRPGLACIRIDNLTTTVPAADTTRRVEAALEETESVAAAHEEQLHVMEEQGRAALLEVTQLHVSRAPRARPHGASSLTCSLRCVADGDGAVQGGARGAGQAGA